MSYINKEMKMSGLVGVSCPSLAENRNLFSNWQQSERGPVGLMIFRFDTGTEASSTVAFIVSLSGFEASAK